MRTLNSDANSNLDPSLPKVQQSDKDSRFSTVNSSFYKQSFLSQPSVNDDEVAQLHKFMKGTSFGKNQTYNNGAVTTSKEMFMPQKIPSVIIGRYN